MKSRILFVAGLALFWPLLRNSFFGTFFSGSTTVLVPGLFYAALCAIAVLAWIRPGVIARVLLTSRWVLCAVCAAGSATLALCAGAESLGVDANGLVAFAALVNGGCVAVLAIGWAAAARYDSEIRPKLLPLLGWSFFLSFLAMGLFLANGALAKASWVLFPALSGLAWTLIPTRSRQMRLMPKGLLLPKGFPLLWVIAAFMLLSAILIGLYDSGFVAYSTDHDNVRYYFSLLFSVALIPCLYAVRRNSHLRLIIWSAVLLVVFAGAFFAVPFTDSLQNARWDVLMAGRTALWALYWSLLVEISHARRLSTVAIIGLFFLLVRGVSSMGIEAISLFLPVLPLSEQTALLLTLFVVFMLVVCMFLFIWLGTSSHMEGTVEHDDAESTHPSSTAPAGSSREDACESIRQRYDLTERETEVLSMLSQGYTTKRMAEELFVSDNTVRSHVKSLYRKTDLHSRQDAIDFVNAHMAS